MRVKGGFRDGEGSQGKKGVKGGFSLGMIRMCFITLGHNVDQTVWMLKGHPGTLMGSKGTIIFSQLSPSSKAPVVPPRTFPLLETTGISLAAEVMFGDAYFWPVKQRN